MHYGEGNDEAAYQTWLFGYGNRGLSNTTVLKRIWVYLQPGKAHKYRRGIYNLICFASRNRRTQSELIRRLCRRADLDFWPIQISRSGCVYRRASYDLEAVRAHLEGVPTAARYGYFHMVLDHKLVRCNKEEIKYLHDPVRSEYQGASNKGRRADIAAWMNCCTGAISNARRLGSITGCWKTGSPAASTSSVISMKT